MKKLIILIVALLSVNTFSQQGNMKIGADMDRYRQVQGAFYDYSDPEAINIRVSVWGNVKFPGIYLVPNYTPVRELLGYTGGPTNDALLQDLRFYRVDTDSSRLMIKFNYNDLLWEEKLAYNKETLPSLQAGDIVVVPGQPRYYFRENLTMTLSVLSAATSVAILLISIFK